MVNGWVGLLVFMEHTTPELLALRHIPEQFVPLPVDNDYIIYVDAHKISAFGNHWRKREEHKLPVEVHKQVGNFQLPPGLPRPEPDTNCPLVLLQS